MANFSPLPSSSPPSAAPIGLPAKAAAMAPPSQPPSQQEIQALLKDIQLGSGDASQAAEIRLGHGKGQFCFLDLPAERPVSELIQAARRADSAAELEELAYEVQDRAGIGELDASDACAVLGEVVMNPHVAPRTIDDIAQYAVGGLNQKDARAAFGANPAYADLISSLAQAPVRTRESDAAMAGLDPERFGPAVAPHLRQPVRLASERVRQGQLANLKARIQEIHGSRSPQALAALASNTLGQLRAGKLDESDGALLLGELLAHKAIAPRTSAEIVNYALQGLQIRNAKWAGGVNRHCVDLLARAAESPATPKQALAILAALRPEQYPPAVAPQLRGVVAQAAVQLKPQ